MQPSMIAQHINPDTFPSDSVWLFSFWLRNYQMFNKTRRNQLIFPIWRHYNRWIFNPPSLPWRCKCFPFLLRPAQPHSPLHPPVPAPAHGADKVCAAPVTPPCCKVLTRDAPFSGQNLNKWVRFSCPGDDFKNSKHANACHQWEANVGRWEGTAGGIRNQGSPNCTENLSLCFLISSLSERENSRDHLHIVTQLSQAPP